VWADGEEQEEDYEESIMNKNKRVREGAPKKFEPKDDEEFEDDFEGGTTPEEVQDEEEFEDEEMSEEDNPMPDEELGEEEFEGEEMPEEDFEGEEDGCEGDGVGMITIGGKRFCIVLVPVDDIGDEEGEEDFDDEEAEEEAEGETPEEEAEEGEEGEAEEEAEEGEGENPFAARDEKLKDDELEEAVRLGMSDKDIMRLYGR